MIKASQTIGSKDDTVTALERAMADLNRHSIGGISQVDCSEDTFDALASQCMSLMKKEQVGPIDFSFFKYKGVPVYRCKFKNIKLDFEGMRVYSSDDFYVDVIVMK